MFRKFVGAIITHFIAGLLITGVTDIHLPINNVGNNELKSGYVEDVILVDGVELLIFNIDGEEYMYVDSETDMYKDDYCLFIINTKGTKSIEDDIILDYRSYWDCENGEYIFEPNAERY